jgi:hypothetical protein
VDAVKGSWIEYLNDETASVRKLEPTLDHGVLRRSVLEEMEEDYEFPLKSVVRGVVVTTRQLDELPIEVRGPDESSEGPRRFLELAPEGYEDDTWDLLGGPLIPTDRRLEAGAVVTAALELLDPERYHINPPGFLAHLSEIEVEVPVEP